MSKIRLIHRGIIEYRSAQNILTRNTTSGAYRGCMPMSAAPSAHRAQGAPQMGIWAPVGSTSCVLGLLYLALTILTNKYSKFAVYLKESPIISKKSWPLSPIHLLFSIPDFFTADFCLKILFLVRFTCCKVLYVCQRLLSACYHHKTIRKSAIIAINRGRNRRSTAVYILPTRGQQGQNPYAH